MTNKINKLNSSQEIDSRARRIAILALAVGSFAIGTAEFVSMGLLPEMANATDVNESKAGLYISSYALGVVFGAPILAVATAKYPRKYVLVALMLCYALFNVASAFVTNFPSLVGFRFMSGLPHGIFFGVASIAAASMVPMRERPKAIGNVMLGLTVATVVGAPSATWIGQKMGWESAFVLVGLVALASALLIMRFLPAQRTAITSSPLSELGALKRKQVWFMLAMVAVGMAGFFAVFSYIKLILMNVSGVPLEYVPYVMPLTGLGMVFGNIYGPKLALKIGEMRTISFSLLWIAVAYFIFFFLSHHAITAAIGCFIVGTAFLCIPSIQTRVMDVAGDAQTLAGSLMQSAFNTANALGAFLGGKVIDLGFNYQYTAILGGILAICGLGIFCISWYYDKRDNKQIA